MRRVVTQFHVATVHIVMHCLLAALAVITAAVTSSTVRLRPVLPEQELRAWVLAVRC